MCGAHFINKLICSARSLLYSQFVFCPAFVRQSDSSIFIPLNPFDFCVRMRLCLSDIGTRTLSFVCLSVFMYAHVCMCELLLLLSSSCDLIIFISLLVFSLFIHLSLLVLSFCFVFIQFFAYSFYSCTPCLFAFVIQFNFSIAEIEHFDRA